MIFSYFSIKSLYSFFYSEIANLQKDMKNQMTGAIRGQLPDSKTTIPNFLTPEKTLKIYEKIMKTSAIKIREVFQQLKSEGFIRFFNIFPFIYIYYRIYAYSRIYRRGH